MSTARRISRRCCAPILSAALRSAASQAPGRWRFRAPITTTPVTRRRWRRRFSNSLESRPAARAAAHGKSLECARTWTASTAVPRGPRTAASPARTAATASTCASTRKGPRWERRSQASARRCAPLLAAIIRWMAARSSVAFVWTRSGVALLMLLAPAALLAQAPPSCRIPNYGIFTEVETYRSREAPGTAGGKEMLAHPRAAIERTDRVPARLGVMFGVVHDFDGIPEGGFVAALLRHPPLPAAG